MSSASTRSRTSSRIVLQKKFSRQCYAVGYGTSDPQHDLSSSRKVALYQNCARGCVTNATSGAALLERMTTR
eukprot:7935346-Pyramimonas_sp.AAC.1